MKTLCSTPQPDPIGPNWQGGAAGEWQGKCVDHRLRKLQKRARQPSPASLSARVPRSALPTQERTSTGACERCGRGCTAGPEEGSSDVDDNVRAALAAERSCRRRRGDSQAANPDEQPVESSTGARSNDMNSCSHFSPAVSYALFEPFSSRCSHC
ncbi:hypothetical protein TcG_05455 [Trypanosoma cruzi]|nr:hypothetical protein TcG_05455 [Trypanosoma cruzi]